MILKALILATALVLSVFGNENVENPDKGHKQDVEIEWLVPPSEYCTMKSENKNLLKVDYLGYLPDGTKIESTYDNKKPLLLQLGSGTLIRGLEKGLIDMCVGEKRKLTIPPNLAFGKRGHGVVPPHSPVIYEVELLDIRHTPGASDAFNTLDSNGDGFLEMRELRDKLESLADIPGLPMKLDSKMKDSMVQMVFNSADKNKDMVLSETEFMRIPGLKKFLKKQQDKKKDEL